MQPAGWPPHQAVPRCRYSIASLQPCCCTARSLTTCLWINLFSVRVWHVLHRQVAFVQPCACAPLSASLTPFNAQCSSRTFSV